MKLIIYQDMTTGVSRPFRIAEIFKSIDGFRTRVTQHCFSSLDEAKYFISTENQEKETAE